MKSKFDPKLLIAAVVVALAVFFVLRGFSTGQAGPAGIPLRVLDGSTVQVGGATGKPTVVKFFASW